MVEVDHRVGEVDVDFGTKGGFEVEVEVVFLVKVGRALFGVVERIAEEVELVVDDMLVEVVRNDVVQGFHFCAGAIQLLDHAHRHHAGTETRHIGSLAHLLQGLFNHFFVIGLFNIDFDGDEVLSFCTLCDVHFYIVDCL